MWRWLLLSVCWTTVGFSEGMASAHYSKGVVANYYHYPQVSAQRTYYGGSQSQCQPNGYGGYSCQFGYQVNATYQASNPQGPLAAGNYQINAGRTESNLNARAADDQMKRNEELGRRVTSITRAHTTLQEARVVLEEEVKTAGLPAHFRSMGLDAIQAMERGMRHWKNAHEGKNEHTQAGNEILKSWEHFKALRTKHRNETPEALKEAGERVIKMLDDALEDATNRGMFWKEF